MHPSSRELPSVTFPVLLLLSCGVGHTTPPANNSRRLHNFTPSRACPTQAWSSTESQLSAYILCQDASIVTRCVLRCAVRVPSILQLSQQYSFVQTPKVFTTFFVVLRYFHQVKICGHRDENSSYLKKGVVGSRTTENRAVDR